MGRPKGKRTDSVKMLNLYLLNPKEVSKMDKIEQLKLGAEIFANEKMVPLMKK